MPAAAPFRAGGTVTNDSRYVNPLAQANVTPERIDMGVDYAGTGRLLAIARGVVTQVNPGGWGGFGNYIEYKITQQGPLFGRSVYYAEGVTPNVTVGQVLNPGDAVATLIPGWHSGIEVGYGSGISNTTYASAYGGGYKEGQATAAGVAFSDLIKKLGGRPGLLEGRSVTGTGPSGSATDTGIPGAGAAIDTATGAIGGAIDAGKAIAGFVSNPIPVVLTVALVIGGALMIYSGLGRMLGFQAPVSSSARAAARAAARGATA